VKGKRKCEFIPDSKAHEDYWRCTVHHTRGTNPLEPCFFSRYDGTLLELCTGWSYDGCPRYAYCHAEFLSVATLCPLCRKLHRHPPGVPVESVCSGKGAKPERRKCSKKN
jgi:hypothetical protein